MQVGQWKKETQAQAKSLFEGKRRPAPVTAHSAPDRLYGEIGCLKMELDWLKKSPGSACHDEPHLDRQWGNGGFDVAMRPGWCMRSAVYARQKLKPIALDDEVLKRLIDEEYTRLPFHRSRKMVVCLGRCGHCVNRKRAQRLMHTLGLVGMVPGLNTSRAHPQHKVYPYLLRGVAVVKPNQVWSTDITYIRLARGFAYLVAVIDWYSAQALS